MKKLLIPILFASTAFTSCMDSEDKNSNTSKIGDKKYTILKPDVVGVEVDHDDIAAFLRHGNIEDGEADDRRSIYFLREGAVITEYHTGSTNATGSSPRPIRQMLDFELEEFKAAKNFYEQRMGTKQKADTTKEPVQQQPIQQDTTKAQPQ